MCNWNGMPHLGFKLNPAILFPRRRLCGCALARPWGYPPLYHGNAMRRRFFRRINDFPFVSSWQGTSAGDHDKGWERIRVIRGQCRAAGETPTRGIAWELGSQWFIILYFRKVGHEFLFLENSWKSKGDCDFLVVQWISQVKSLFAWICAMCNAQFAGMCSGKTVAGR